MVGVNFKRANRFFFSDLRDLIAGLRRLDKNPGGLCSRVGWGYDQNIDETLFFRPPGFDCGVEKIG